MRTTPSAASARALIISGRVYRILLAAYPAEFRRRYGPEMAQVFRTCCRAAYDSSGVNGVLRVWLLTLRDWAWSASSERFSSLFGRSQVYNMYPRHSCSELIPVLLFWSGCLILLVLNPFSWLRSESPFGTEICGLRVDNQSGKILRVTPLYTYRRSYSSVRLYRGTFPFLPAYQQRNISVKSGDQATLSYACSENGIPVLYACDPEGECYVQQRYTIGNLMVIGYKFSSLETLSPPDAALEAAIQSIPEHDNSGMSYILLCVIGVAALIGGIYTLVRPKTIEMPKSGI
jgi:hypothetical protein